MRTIRDRIGFAHVVCGACGFVQLHADHLVPASDVYTDAYFNGAFCVQTAGRIGYAKSYLDGARSHRAGYYERYADELVALMRRQGIPLTRVLDFGCGYGAFLNVLRGRLGDGVEVHGIELDPVVCARASSNLAGAPVYCGDLKAGCSAVPQRYFDAISLLDVIEHLDDPRAYLTRLAECATDAGFLLVSTPNIDSLNAKLYRDRWVLHSPPLHVSYFGSRSLAILLDATGWGVRYMRTEGTVLHNERHGMETWRGKLARAVFHHRMCDVLTNRVLRVGSVTVAIAQRVYPTGPRRRA